MSYEVSFKNRTAVDIGSWLASIPVITPSVITRDRYDIPCHTGDILSSDFKRGNATITCLFHTKGTSIITLEERLDALRYWLQGTGNLIISNTSSETFYDQTNKYEVVNVVVSNTKYYDDNYARLGAKFEVYPYKFVASGDTGIALSNGSTVKNNFDVSEPLYKISATNGGTIAINSGTSFTIKTISATMIVDVRRKIAYNQQTGANMSSYVQGDYNVLKLVNGNNVFAITNSMGITLYPKWGITI